MKNEASQYAKAGVDLAASDKAKTMMKRLVDSTHNNSVLSAHGGFGGLYSLKELTGTDKVLVGSADGVGTKLKLAFMSGKHDTIGQDLVNHLVDDILCCGARPMFFFDYLGLGQVDPSTTNAIVEGLAKACNENNTVLLGGETAEMPGFYGEGEYDVAGFIVGWVDREKIIDGSKIKAGDLLIGLKSNGLHTNGYSLARSAFFDQAAKGYSDNIEECNLTVGEELLRTHRSYLAAVSPALDKNLIKGIAHITGGGFEGNLDRIIPEGVTANVQTSSWEVPGVFKAIARLAQVSKAEMYRVFNMGVGMILVCGEEHSDAVIAFAESADVEALIVGKCETGQEKVNVKF